MPIYEYLCDQCGKKFEALRSFSSADDPIDCEACHSAQTHRTVSASFAHSGGRVVAGGASSSACAGCSAGSCSTCGH